VFFFFFTSQVSIIQRRGIQQHVVQENRKMILQSSDLSESLV